MTVANEGGRIDRRSEFRRIADHVDRHGMHCRFTDEANKIECHWRHLGVLNHATAWFELDEESDSMLFSFIDGAEGLTDGDEEELALNTKAVLRGERPSQRWYAEEYS